MGASLKSKILMAAGLILSVAAVIGCIEWFAHGEQVNLEAGQPTAMTAQPSNAILVGVSRGRDDLSTASPPIRDEAMGGTGPEHVQTASPDTTIVQARNEKPVRKKISKLTPRERRHDQEGHAHRMKIARLRIANARSAAHDDRACHAGDDQACSRLVDASGNGDRRLILTQVRKELSGACASHDLNACIHRGDLAIAGADKSGAASWYDKAKAIASQIKSTCDAGNTVHPRKCTRARRLLDAINRREQRLAAHDTGARTPVKASFGNSKRPHAAPMPLSKLMEKANIAPQSEPVQLLDGTAAPAAEPRGSP